VRTALDHESRFVRRAAVWLLRDWGVRESAPALIARLTPEAFPDPEPCWSTFQMVRVPDDADCDWLEAELVTLFPEVEPTLPE